MSSFSAEYLEFDFPQKPRTSDPYEIAESIVEWTDANMPYTTNNSYRPEHSMEVGGGTCYSLAQTTGRLAEHWNVPSGILLDREHAKSVIKCGAALLFLDTVKKGEGVMTLQQHIEAQGWGSPDELTELYREHLPQALESGDFGIYFYERSQLEEGPVWKAHHAPYIRTDQDLVGSGNTHIITDLRRGKDMLCAIGDLNRYRATDTERYAEAYPELISSVPDFKHVPVPGSHYPHEI